MTAKEKKLWAAYQRTRSLESRNELVKLYYPKLAKLCHGQAPKIGARSRTAGRLRDIGDDDVSEAVATLIQCVETFDPNRGTEFVTWLHRGIHQGINNARRYPGIGEVGDTSGTVKTKELSEDIPAGGCEPQAEREEELRRDCEAILRSKRHVDLLVALLRPQERRAIQLIFFEGMTTGEAAKRMKVTPGRVSQLKKSALAKIRDMLGGT